VIHLPDLRIRPRLCSVRSAERRHPCGATARETDGTDRRSLILFGKRSHLRRSTTRSCRTVAGAAAATHFYVPVPSSAPSPLESLGSGRSSV
jgi:hypothetical protein